MIHGLITDPTQWVTTLAAAVAPFDHPSPKADSKGYATMTGEYDDTPTPDLWLTRIKDVFAVIASIIVLMASLWWIAIFFTGGIKSQDQFAVQDLTRSVAAVQLSISGLSSQISAMPRPSDYSGIIDHLRELDQRNAALSEQIIQQRVDFAKLTTQFEWLSHHGGGK